MFPLCKTSSIHMMTSKCCSTIREDEHVTGSYVFLDIFGEPDKSSSGYDNDLMSESHFQGWSESGHTELGMSYMNWSLDYDMSLLYQDRFQATKALQVMLDLGEDD